MRLGRIATLCFETTYAFERTSPELPSENATGPNQICREQRSTGDGDGSRGGWLFSNESAPIAKRGNDDAVAGEIRMRVGSGVPWLTDGTSAGLWAKCTLQQLTGARRWDFGQKLLQHPAALAACACSHMPPPTESMMRSARAIVPERQNIAKTLVKAGFPGKARFYESSLAARVVDSWAAP